MLLLEYSGRRVVMKRCIALFIALIFVSAYAGAADAPATRGDFAAALWEVSGSTNAVVPVSFSDVGANEPYTEGVGWCYERGLMLGTGDGLFAPERPITREEAATVFRRYCAYIGMDTFYPSGVAACNEYESISPWADDSLYWACGEGWMEWSEGGRLDPQGAMTTTQVQQLLSRPFQS
ncbi:MAG: S-layer homology domain-containing protein [Clostridia bacterium]|nr:S-layer homology domain-containing protein [Clostridia bacterium]